MKVLQQTGLAVLEHLKSVIVQLDNEAYAKPLPILSDSSIGKHVRHVIEFFDCMLQGMESELVDYDNRKRNLLLETDTAYTLAHLNRLIGSLQTVTENKPLELVFSYAQHQTVVINTLLYREMVYNIEHAIHHLAIIKIAIKQDFDYVLLPSNFGVAYATLQYHQQQCVQ